MTDESTSNDNKEGAIIDGGAGVSPDSRLSAIDRGAADVGKMTLDQNVADNDADLVDKIVQRAGGVAALIMSSVFNEAAMPPGFLEKYGTAMVWANRAARDWSIGNGAGRVDEKSQQERAEDEARRSLNEFADQMDGVEEQLQRDREEWAHTQHSYFGANLTGQEWDELGDDIGKAGKLRSWLVKRLMQQGKTEGEAEKKADEMSEVFKILGKPESQWTAEQRAKVEAAKTDPDYQKNTAQLAEQRGLDSAPVTHLEEKAMYSTGPKSVEVGADVLNGGIARNLDLTEEHRMAVAAKEPLDAPKAPVQVALAAAVQAAPPPPSSGGFDA